MFSQSCDGNTYLFLWVIQIIQKLESRNYEVCYSQFSGILTKKYCAFSSKIFVTSFTNILNALSKWIIYKYCSKICFFHSHLFHVSSYRASCYNSYLKQSGALMCSSMLECVLSIYKALGLVPWSPPPAKVKSRWT